MNEIVLSVSTKVDHLQGAEWLMIATMTFQPVESARLFPTKYKERTMKDP